MVDEVLSQFLQEGLLTLLCFDDKRAAIICNSVALNLWEGDYRTIAAEVYGYINRQRKNKRAPKSHVADLLESILKGDDKRRAKHFRTILRSMNEESKIIDADFTMGRLSNFIRRQTTIESIIEAGDLIQTGNVDDETLDRAEQILAAATKRRLDLFDPGIFLGDPQKSLSYLKDPEDVDIFRTGIKELDKLRLGPTRGGLHLFIAPFKKGKSWWLTSLGKYAALDGHKVAHVTLEMGEEQVTRRYHQTFLAVARRRHKQEFRRVGFRTDDDGHLESVKVRKFKPRHALDDEDIGEFLSGKLNKRIGRQMNRVVVKQFPTSKLTIAGLEAYLDNLEYQFGFMPDLLIVDYPKLMAYDPKNFRLEHGRIIESLRGIGIERNLAVATVGQTNRGALDDRSDERRRRVSARRVGIQDTGEDISQIGTADTIFTFSQTVEEHALGLARLFVAAARDEVDQFSVLISQHYATGQFCRASVRMQGQYWDILEGLSQTENGIV